MNTVLWLTAGILAQAGIGSPEPPPTPEAVNRGGGPSSRKQFVVSGRRGSVVITDPRLIQFFLKILNGEEPTELQISETLIPLALDYKVPLTDNIDVLSKLMDQLETYQETLEAQAKENQELVRQDQVAKDASSYEHNSQLAVDYNLALLADASKGRALDFEVTNALEVWLKGVASKAQQGLDIKSAQRRVQTARITNLKKRIETWTQTVHP